MNEANGAQYEYNNIKEQMEFELWPFTCVFSVSCQPTFHNIVNKTSNCSRNDMQTDQRGKA